MNLTIVPPSPSLALSLYIRISFLCMSLYVYVYVYVYVGLVAGRLREKMGRGLNLRTVPSFLVFILSCLRLLVFVLL